MNNKKERKVCGIGVNDSPDPVVRYGEIEGKFKIVWKCPYYRVWENMLSRCGSEAYLRVRPTYRGCSIDQSWVSFTRFKDWMMTQDWEGKALDKDILVNGNRVYSPRNCRFVDKTLNSFILDSAGKRGEFPLGVDWYKKGSKYRARCKNPFTKKVENLGYFDCPQAAHEAWRERKHQHALRWADLQDDPYIAEALRKRFTPKLI